MASGEDLSLLRPPGLPSSPASQVSSLLPPGCPASVPSDPSGPAAGHYDSSLESLGVTDSEASPRVEQRGDTTNIASVASNGTALDVSGNAKADGA